MTHKPFEEIDMNNIVSQCATATHADLFRRTLDAKGYAAISAVLVATDTEPGEEHVVLSIAPQVTVERMLELTYMVSTAPPEILAAYERALKSTVPSVNAPSAAERDLGRALLLAALASSPVAFRNVQPSPATDAPGAHHDSGDEDTKPAPVKNPEGGGWEERCREEQRLARLNTARAVPQDPYDSWKSAR
jgi:hypothetical protein